MGRTEEPCSSTMASVWPQPPHFCPLFPLLKHRGAADLPDCFQVCRIRNYCSCLSKMILLEDTTVSHGVLVPQSL